MGRNFLNFQGEFFLENILGKFELLLLLLLIHSLSTSEQINLVKSTRNTC